MGTTTRRDKKQRQIMRVRGNKSKPNYCCSEACCPTHDQQTQWTQKQQKGRETKQGIVHDLHANKLNIYYAVWFKQWSLRRRRNVIRGQITAASRMTGGIVSHNLGNRWEGEWNNESVRAERWRNVSESRWRGLMKTPVRMDSQWAVPCKTLNTKALSK